MTSLDRNPIKQLMVLASNWTIDTLIPGALIQVWPSLKDLHLIGVE